MGVDSMDRGEVVDERVLEDWRHAVARMHRPPLLNGELQRLLEFEKISAKDSEDFLVVLEQLMSTNGELLAISDSDLRAAIEVAFLTSDAVKLYYSTKVRPVGCATAPCTAFSLSRVVVTCCHLGATVDSTRFHPCRFHALPVNFHSHIITFPI